MGGYGDSCAKSGHAVHMYSCTGSADGTSLDLRTEMVTVLGADVRSSEFVAEYLLAAHMVTSGRYEGRLGEWMARVRRVGLGNYLDKTVE